jgi:MFS family permease
VSRAFRRTFASLTIPNYRRYFTGQVVSISGNWMQTVAEMWLIVGLTGSGVAVGITAGLQFLPVLLFGAWGGLLADRLGKRGLLTATQLLMALPALALWGLTAGGAIEAWMVYGLVLARGVVTAIDNPARQAFVMEMVGPGRVVNAVALNSVVVHTARILGPAAAGVIIALVGVATCFALNALTFVVMVVALRRMDPSALRTPAPVPRQPGQLRSGLAYVARTPALRIPLAMMALVGTVSFNFQVLLPLLAAETWHGTATTYALLTAAMGVGSVAGALVAGARARVGSRLLVAAAGAFGVAELLVALAPSLWSQALALVPLGAASVTFAAGVNSSLQLNVAPDMRGRVMALYSVVFLGSTPIGAPLVGWLAEVAGPRGGLLAGAAAAGVAAAVARVAFARASAEQVDGVVGDVAAAAGDGEDRAARALVGAGAAGDGQRDGAVGADRHGPAQGERAVAEQGGAGALEDRRRDRAPGRGDVADGVQGARARAGRVGDHVGEGHEVAARHHSLTPAGRRVDEPEAAERRGELERALPGRSLGVAGPGAEGEQRDGGGGHENGEGGMDEAGHGGPFGTGGGCPEDARSGHLPRRRPARRSARHPAG